jgi:hypothetical protein
VVLILDDAVPENLVDILHGASSAGWRLQPDFLDAVLQRMQARLVQLSSRALSHTAFAVSQLSLRPAAAWLAAFCSATAPLVSAAEGTDIVSWLTMLAACEHIPEEAWMAAAVGRCEATLQGALLRAAKLAAAK